MSRQFKKLMSLAAGFAAGLFFVMSVCIDVMAVMDCMNDEISFGALCLILAFSGVVMFICMVFIIVFNRVFDEGEGLVQKNFFMGRWPMNTLFVSLSGAVVFIMLYAPHFSDRTLLASSRNTSYFILVIAVLLAVLVYIGNYHRFLPRHRQIRAAEKTYALGKRRFTFLIEEYLEDGRLKGKISGKIRTGDKAFVLNGIEEDPKTVRIRAIETDLRKVRFAKDTEAVLTVSIPERYADRIGFADYTVLSSVRTGSTIFRHVSAENPRISAMLSVYNAHMDERDFMSTFIYDCVHGHYLTAAACDEEDAVTGDITEAMRGSHNVMFQAVSSSRDPDKSVFPVFTDWEALSLYRTFMESDQAVALIMDFPQASEMLKKGYDGIVINPFGPAPYYLSDEYIRSIKSLDGYRKEFVLEEEPE